jgi:hypothetical protein
MIPWAGKSKKYILSRLNLREEPYLVINTVFAIIIVFIMAYSAIFSPDKDNYPITCIHEQLTGEPCASCGVSHSFSLILRGRIEEAYKYNENGMRVFIFFFSQLLMRIFFSIYYISHISTRKQLILLDIIGSSGIFLIAFLPFIIFFFKWL